MHNLGVSCAVIMNDDPVLSGGLPGVTAIEAQQTLTTHRGWR